MGLTFLSFFGSILLGISLSHFNTCLGLISFSVALTITIGQHYHFKKVNSLLDKYSDILDLRGKV